VKHDVAPPEGVLRAYVWDCGGGHELRMKNLFREDAITLEMHEGPRKLTRVVAASGATYSDGALTFWTKGSTAILERSGSAPVTCSELRARSIEADARERGVRYRGTGNEPGWLVEIGPGSHLLYAGDYGEDRREFDGVTERSGSPEGAQVFAAGAETDGILVTVTRAPCADDMSGEAFDHRIELDVGGRRYRGCATAIQ
jgi:putative lipoprotein